MIQEKVRLGKSLALPQRWREAIHAADGDELTVLCHDDAILIVKDIARLDESLRVFSKLPTPSRDDYAARIAELAAEYETCGLVQLAAEYDGPGEPMSPELEALYLEAKQEIYQSQRFPNWAEKPRRAR